MKIIKDSTSDISNCFRNFQDLIDDVDYVMSVSCKKFRYEIEQNIFKMSDLKNLFAEETNKIDGDLCTASWDSFSKKITKKLRYATYFHGVNKDIETSFKLVSDSVLQTRLQCLEDKIGRAHV